MPFRLTGWSRPTETASLASWLSDAASGSSVNVISLNAAGRTLDLMPLPSSLMS